MATTITRVSFCPECFKRNRPRADQLFLVHGSTCNQFHIKDAMKNGTRGFTPHIVELLKVDGENVIYRKACGMNHCDTEIYFSNGDFNFEIQRWSRGIIPLNQWNAWVMYKHDTNYEI